MPFSVEINPQAPPSVQLVPAKRYYGAPIGTSYDVRCYVGQYYGSRYPQSTQPRTMGNVNPLSIP